MKVLALINDNEYEVVKEMRRISSLKKNQNEAFSEYMEFLRDNNLQVPVTVTDDTFDDTEKFEKYESLRDEVHYYDDQIVSIRNRLKSKL